MVRNYFLINLLLILTISVLGFKFYKVATDRVTLPAAPVAQEKQTRVPSVKHVERSVNAASYDVISDLDLFRPSRSPAERKEVKTQKGPLKDPPKLFGTIILNKLKTAILEDPDTKSTKNYSVNDTVAGYVITDILQDKVVLQRDGETYEVKLRESKGIAPPKRRSVKRPATRNARKAVNKPRRQRRPQRTRRAVPPRSTRAPVPDDVQSLMDNLEEIDR
jgi:type II secretory pathway component PulC